MKPWLTLYLKDLREHRAAAALVLAVATGIQVVALARINLPPGPGDVGLAILAVVPVALPLLIAPFYLSHLYTSESKGNTHHLTFSLPVPRWWLGLSKWCAVLSLSAVLFVVACGVAYILYRWIAAHLGLDPIGLVDFWVIAIARWLAISLLSLGLITAMEGLRSSVKRFRTLLAGGFLGICLFTFARLLSPATDLLRFLGTYRYEGTMQDSLVHTLDLSVIAFPALYGLLMLVLGLYLYNRFSEI
jgi:hypothetical protein